MVKQVTSFETSDGKKFTSEIEALGHEQLLQIGGAIEAYAKAASLQPAEATRAKKYISGYVAFLKTYDGPMELPAPVKEAANDASAGEGQATGTEG